MNQIFFIFYIFEIYNSFSRSCNNCCYCKNKTINKNLDNNNNNNDKDIKDLNGVTESILKSIANKKIFFSYEDRKKPDFKHFKFIKNMFPNGDNRCWLISEIIVFFNTTQFQEILLNNVLMIINI